MARPARGVVGRSRPPAGRRAISVERLADAAEIAPGWSGGDRRSRLVIAPKAALLLDGRLLVARRGCPRPPPGTEAGPRAAGTATCHANGVRAETLLIR